MTDILTGFFIAVSLTLIVMTFVYYIVGAVVQFVRWLIDF